MSGPTILSRPKTRTNGLSRDKQFVPGLYVVQTPSQRRPSKGRSTAAEVDDLVAPELVERVDLLPKLRYGVRVHRNLHLHCVVFHTDHSTVDDTKATSPISLSAVTSEWCLVISFVRIRAEGNTAQNLRSSNGQPSTERFFGEGLNSKRDRSPRVRGTLLSRRATAGCIARSAPPRASTPATSRSSISSPPRRRVTSTRHFLV